MTDLAQAVSEAALSAESWYWQPALATCGAALLALVPVCGVWAWRDERTVHGESVSAKPARFALSIGVYMLTTSAMFSCVRPGHRGDFLPRATVWIMIIGSTVELACIVLQAARARRSHFNTSTSDDAAIYATMGVFALLFIGGVLPLAWEIARRPNAHVAPLMVQAVVAGLLATFVAGGGTGALMSARGGALVDLPRRRVPLLGWYLSGGDIRIPHFFGIHAMQALPFIAAGALRIKPARAAPLFAIGATAYAVVTAGMLYQVLGVRRATKIKTRQELQ